MFNCIHNGIETDKAYKEYQKRREAFVASIVDKKKHVGQKEGSLNGL